MTKIVKNVDSIDHTYSGQLIVAGGQYTIQETEYGLWASDSMLITDIGNGLIILNDGSNDAASVSESIDILKGLNPISTSLTGGRSGYSYQADRLAVAVTALGGDLQQFDYDLSTNQIGLTGGTLYMDSSAKCRWSAEFVMIDTLGILGNGAGYQIQQFIIAGGIEPGGQVTAKDRDDVYIDTPFPGLVLRVIIHYNGAGGPLTTAYGWVNLDRSIKVV